MFDVFYLNPKLETGNLIGNLRSIRFKLIIGPPKKEVTEMNSGPCTNPILFSIKVQGCMKDNIERRYPMICCDK